MSEHKVSAGTMLLFIDPNGGTEYDTVICLKSVSITDSVASIDISSWCGPGKLPGLNDITLSFDGYHIQDPDSLRISGTDLRILLRNKTTIGWKLSPESPVGGDEIQSGQGFLDSLSSTYAFDSVGSFNFTINVKGNVTTTIQPSFYIGMEYGGGIIAYIDETGQHGIIRSNNFESESYYQWCSVYQNGILTYANTDSYGYGLINTDLNISVLGPYNGHGYCRGLTTGGFTDWFMPTAIELFYIYSNGQIPYTVSNYILSSVEYSSTQIYIFDTSSGVYYPFDKIYFDCSVLPCRYF